MVPNEDLILFRWILTCCNLSKQCRPWSDAAFCGVWSGSALFANVQVRVLQIILFSLHSDITVTWIALLWITVTWISSNAPLWLHWSMMGRLTTTSKKFWCLYTLARLQTIYTKSTEVTLFAQPTVVIRPFLKIWHSMITCIACSL